jgi:hypothetical protein
MATKQLHKFPIVDSYQIATEVHISPSRYGCGCTHVYVELWDKWDSASKPRHKFSFDSREGNWDFWPREREAILKFVEIMDGFYSDTTKHYCDECS